MKRAGNLISLIADPENLRLAFWKARKGKEGKAEVQGFIKNLDNNLLKLRKEILSGEVNVGNYHYFTIFDPKERLICAAEFHERVLHHAIMNVCHSIFEKYQIDGSYASRLGKGTYAAIEQAGINQRKYKWFLKLDVRKYFDSIDHQVLKQLLERKIKDYDLLQIFSKIIDTYSTKTEKGLPFCGYLIYPNKVLLNKGSRRRYLTKYRKYTNFLNSGEWSQSDFQAHILPLIAFTEHACCKGLRKRKEL